MSYCIVKRLDMSGYIERNSSLGLLLPSEQLALIDLWAQLCCQTISELVQIVTEYRIGWVLDESDFPVVVEARGSRGWEQGH